MNITEWIRPRFTLVIACALCGCGGGKSSRPTMPLEIVEAAGSSVQHGAHAVLDMGTVPQGGAKTLPFKLRNAATTPLNLSSFQSSCECSRIVGLPATMQPGRAIELKIVADFSKEKEYRGDVGVRMSIRDERDVPLLEFQVDVSVR